MNTARQDTIVAANERGYHHPRISSGRLIVTSFSGGEVDYTSLLASRGLVKNNYFCDDWRDACHLMGMLPPARSK